MAKQDDAALKLLRWELEGHGDAVLAAMLRHPDKSLADAVELIEQEIKALSPKDPMSELPMPSAPRGRASSELDALGQEFQTFRHLLRPREAKEIEATLKDLARTRDREAMVALRRRLHRGPVPAGAGQGRRLGPHEDGRGDRGERGGGDEDLRQREARGQIRGGTPEAPPEDIAVTGVGMGVPSGGGLARPAGSQARLRLHEQSFLILSKRAGYHAVAWMLPPCGRPYSEIARVIWNFP